MTVKKHANRKPKKSQQQKGGLSRVDRRRQEREMAGNQEIADDQKTASENFKLDWFKPNVEQKEIIYSMCTNDLTLVQGSSGTGKSTTAIYQALSDLKRGCYKKIYFIKTPSEDGDDMIGFLKGNPDEKLTVHFDAMKSIFHTFMSKAKLEAEEKAGRIEFSIPNFIAGKTLDHALVILDEGQKFSPNTMKLLLERAGKDTRIVLLGDKKQRYAHNNREDGLTQFVEMITRIDESNKRVSKEDTMGYIELPSSMNMRSPLSKRIVELYEAE